MESWLDSFARTNLRRSVDTAHDLKTPLNVAVLNLELLRMRLAKIGADDDPKIAGYSAAIEAELRRLGHIFDAFFILSTPPKDSGHPGPVELGSLCAEAAAKTKFELSMTATTGNASMLAHEARIRECLQLFFEGASKLFPAGSAEAVLELSQFVVAVAGQVPAELELTKIFKFYYTDVEGNPDLSLAAARLIAETYGGELIAAQERDKVILRLLLPVGAR